MIYSNEKEEMKQIITHIKTGIFALLLTSGVSSSAWGQNVLYEENMGIPTVNTLIQYYKGWQDTTVIYSGDGTCDVRTSNASTSYGGASGGGNVMINDSVKWFLSMRLIHLLRMSYLEELM